MMLPLLVVSTHVVPDSLAATVVDSAQPALARPIDAHYIAILEKTNQQLSLWLNPYGIMVATLAVLFSVLAIVAAIVIWRQGASYRHLIDSSIEKYRQILDALVAERIKIMQASVDEAIDSYKSQLENADNESKKRIEAALAGLNRNRATLADALKNISANPMPMGGTTINFTDSTANIGDRACGPSSRFRTFYDINLDGAKCLKCGATIPPREQFGVYSIIDGRTTITCPKCGNVQQA